MTANAGAAVVSDKVPSGGVNFAGESRVVTILFSDIRNFTGMPEGMTPQEERWDHLY